MDMENKIKKISIHRKGKKPFNCYNTTKPKYSKAATPNDAIPHWALLEHHQCPNCPLRRDKHKFCPLVLTLYPVLTYLSDVSSIDIIRITIKETLITTKIELPAQDSLLILLPRLVILSNCPHWRYNRWAYRYFSYTSDYQFWIFEALAIALTREFLLNDKLPDKDEILMRVQSRLAALKITIDSLIMRIKGTSGKDAGLNALISGTNLTSLLEMKMDECIKEWKNEIVFNADLTFKD
jgi:Domain of unknown function (DUF6901)